MDKKILKAEPRKVLGKKVRNLRREGLLPGNIYGKKVKSQAVQVSFAEFEKVFKSTGETGLLELALGSEKRPVLIHNIQKDPVSDTPIHIDFLQVDLKEKVTASIPVEMEGESPAEKLGVGTVVQYVNEIEVEALPGDLPERFVVDASALSEVDQAVFVKDLKVDKAKVEIKTDPELILAKVEPPQKEEVAPAPAPAEGAPSALEGATEGQGGSGEEKPAEGGETPQEEQKPEEPKA